MPVDWSSARITVRYRVHLVITALPDSPSSCNFCKRGMTTDRSCMMMLAVM